MELNHTQQYNSFTTKSGNIVWAAAMQLAWTELRNKFTQGSPIQLKTESPKSLEMIENFNQAVFKQSDIDPNSIYVKSGFGQVTLEQINQ